MHTGPGDGSPFDARPALTASLPSLRESAAPRPLSTLPALAAWIEDGGLAGEWRLALGLDARAAFAFAPLSVDLLSPGELARYRTLRDTSARRAWLTGRAALRRLLERLGRDPDTAALAFPRADLSLAHCGGAAVALGLSGPGHGALGLGVDLEADRPMHPQATGFFLTEAERARLEARPAGHSPEAMDASLARLWTVKEALFKADPGNGPRLLADYEVADPSLRRGRAGLRPGLEPRAFRYVSHRLAGWHFSLAAALS